METKLKTLFLHTELTKSKERLVYYNELYNSLEVKDISLKRLITAKDNECKALDALLKNNK